MGASQVGTVLKVGGNVTTLNVITPGAEASLERMVGYHPGRLAKGYSILVLTQSITSHHFEFDGTTMRSGGRLGLPAASPGADEARVRVHDTIMSERGADGYRAFQEWALSQRSPTSGRERIAKIRPEIRHDDDLPPNVQYPMGGGALQWKLTARCAFLVVAYVFPGGTRALAADGKTYQVGAAGYQARLDARRDLRRYMERA